MPIAGGRVDSDTTRRSVSPASFNQDANALAADAAKTIGDVLGHCETLTGAVIGAFREIHYVWQKDGAQ